MFVFKALLKRDSPHLDLRFTKDKNGKVVRRYKKITIDSRSNIRKVIRSTIKKETGYDIGSRFPDITHYDLGEILRGIRVEKEHDNRIGVVLKIVIDHLKENPIYYTRLAKVGLNAH